MSTVKRTTLRSSLKARPVKDLEITADMAYSNVRSSDNSINRKIYGIACITVLVQFGKWVVAPVQ